MYSREQLARLYGAKQLNPHRIEMLERLVDKRLVEREQRKLMRTTLEMDGHHERPAGFYFVYAATDRALKPAPAARYPDDELTTWTPRPKYEAKPGAVDSLMFAALDTAVAPFDVLKRLGAWLNRLDGSARIGIMTVIGMLLLLGVALMFVAFVAAPSWSH